ncbi:hypothetical protein ACEPAI_9991 [Sanghuangporus weigelae]
MDKNAPFYSSRPPSSTSGSVATVTMLRHPSCITDAPRKAQTYVSQMNNSRPLSKPDQPSSTSARLQLQAHGQSVSKSQDPSHDVDSTIAAARLNEFADFLVQFNNTTVVAIDSRLQKMETMVGEHLVRTELALRDHGVQNAMRLGSISRSIRDAVSDTIKQLFSEQEKQMREEYLAKSVSTAVMSGLQPRFDQIYRHMKENTKSTGTLQAYIRSLEERFKKIEEQTPGGFVGSPNAHPVSTSAASLQAPSKSDGPPAPTQRHLEEFGHMLDRLARLVDGARDEAHFDKEDLAKHFHRAHHGFALTLNKEMQTLKNAIGIGKGCLKNFKENGASTTQFSLAEHLESITLDVQELFECFQDSEAAREEEPLAVKHSLEALPNKLPMSHLRRTAVMTDDNQKASAAFKGVPQTKVIYTDSSVQTSPLPATVDVMTSTDCSYLTETRQASVQASPPHATVDVMTSTYSLPSTPDTSTSGSIISTSMEAPVSENVSMLTLVDGELFVPPCFGGNLLPVSSWSIPFPHQWPAPEPLPATKLTLDTDMVAMPEVEQSASTVLQLSGVPLDPSTSLLSPPPSSVSRSPSVSLKRKADDVADNVEFSQSMSRPLIEPNAPPAVKQGDDDYIFDLTGSLSPLTPQNDKLVIDLDRSPSPLTPLTSEAEQDSADDDGEDGVESEEESLPAGDEPSLLTSKDNLSTISQENIIQRVEPASLLQHWCPNGCMLGYSDKESLNRHVKKCPLVKCSNQKNNSSSSASAKRRKLDHDRSESSTSTSSGSSRRGRPRKSKSKAVTHSHPFQVLEKCDWPPKTRINETFDHQFLQCDRCDSSYHYRCIGVKRGDKRLVPDVEFICPPCTHIQRIVPHALPIANAGIKKNNSSCCGRPDCGWPGEASNDIEDYFVVEKILGRSVADVSCPQRIYLWLIKWSGYHIKECDWLEESQLPNADALIRAFFSAAAKEGMKVRDDESIYLLREARKVLHLALKGGWKWA